MYTKAKSLTITSFKSNEFWKDILAHTVILVPMNVERLYDKLCDSLLTGIDRCHLMKCQLRRHALIDVTLYKVTLLIGMGTMWIIASLQNTGGFTLIHFLCSAKRGITMMEDV